MLRVMLATFPLEEGFADTIRTLAETRDEFELTTLTAGKQEIVDAGPENS